MILDSTFLVDMLRRDEAAHGYLEAAEGRAEPLRVPTVCLFELWDGAERARSPAEEQEAMAAVLDGCDLLPLEPRHARRAGSLGGAWPGRASPSTLSTCSSQARPWRSASGC